MATECYALIRGSTIRVTELDRFGAYNKNTQIGYAASKAVTKVTINEVTEAGNNEVLRNDEEEPRLHFVKPDQTVRYMADIEFSRCDPDLLLILSSSPIVQDAAGDTVGFDVNTKMPAASFGLELWSRLDGSTVCAGGVRKYGYTLLPWLRGGYLSGFRFADGLVSFNLRNAFVQRYSRWGYGPYEGFPLLEPVSRNTRFRQFITTEPPPDQTNGAVYFADVVDNGTPSDPGTGAIEGGTPDFTTNDLIDGGSAA